MPAHPVTVAAYLVAAADTLTPDGGRAYAPATLAHHVAAIAPYHRQTGHPSPTGDDLVRATLSGIRRDHATAGDRPRTPRAPLLTTAIVDHARASCANWADEVFERRGTTARDRSRHYGGLFADWYAAAQSPLPATPHTLAEFLHEHPAAAATQRRRVSAVNTVHVDNGHVPPGRSAIARRRLDSGRAERQDRIAALLQRRAVQLSSSGWPAGSFGRRDGMLLILVAAGMTFTQMTRLRRGDITVDDDTLVASVDGQQFRLTFASR